MHTSAFVNANNVAVDWYTFTGIEFSMKNIILSVIKNLMKFRFHWKKVGPKRLHPWSRFMVRNSAPPVALFWHHFQRWSCFRLKKVWNGSSLVNGAILTYKKSEMVPQVVLKWYHLVKGSQNSATFLGRWSQNGSFNQGGAVSDLFFRRKQLHLWKWWQNSAMGGAKTVPGVVLK